MDWNALRAVEFPVTERWAYFDHAAVSPLPRRSGQILREWAEDQERNGVMYWPEWEKKLRTSRDRLASLINASNDEIAFVNSTTSAIGLVAEGFPWKPGDNIVTAEEEYPSNIYPWMNLASRGVSLRTVPTREGRIWVEDLDAAIDESTRLLTISHVEFSSGFRNDLDAIGELCRGRGIAFMVDAIQGLGPLVIDVQRTPIDFIAADGHKWLLGPEGAGFLFVRREWIERLRPLGVGWHSVVSSYNNPNLDFTLKPSAERWEGGSYNMPGLQAFGASLSLLLEIGKEQVSERILSQAQEVREIARSTGWQIVGSNRDQDLSGIVAIQKEGINPDQVVRDFRKAGVAVAYRRGRLRISPHIYQNGEDLERLRVGLASAGTQRLTS